MSKKHIITAIIGCAALASGAIGLSIESAHARPRANRALGVEARIPFADTNGIRNYSADGNRALFIEDVHGDWFHAEIMGPCTGLPFANAIGFITRGGGTLDKFGQIRVERDTCQIASLVTSAPPPKKVKKPKGV